MAEDIKAYSRDGDIVFDLLSDSGITVLEALKNKQHFDGNNHFKLWVWWYKLKQKRSCLSRQQMMMSQMVRDEPTYPTKRVKKLGKGILVNVYEKV